MNSPLRTLVMPLCLSICLQVAATAQDLPEAKRILTMEDGAKVRVVCRLVGQEWQYRNSTGWHSVEARRVRAAHDETVLLKEWRATYKQQQPETATTRLRAARGAAEAGLAVEALAELDAVLKERPDDPAARAIVTEQRLMHLPSALEAQGREHLMKLGPSLPPAAREAVLVELARSPERQALVAVWARDMDAPVVSRRTFAMHALRRLAPGEELRAAALHALLDASAEARVHAALMLAAARDPGVTGPFTQALLESRHALVRERAAEALGHMGYAVAVPALIARLAAPVNSSGGGRPPHAHVWFGTQRAYVQDFDVEVAQFAGVADPVVNTLVEGAVLDVGVVSTLEVRSSEGPAVRGALQRLVGERKNTAREWLTWWESSGKLRYGPSAKSR